MSSADDPDGIWWMAPVRPRCDANSYVESPIAIRAGMAADWRRDPRRALPGIGSDFAGGIAITIVPPFPALRALPIGITDFPGKLFPPLAGPKNDIPLVRTVLVSRLGVPGQNITTLRVEFEVKKP